MNKLQIININEYIQTIIQYLLTLMKNKQQLTSYQQFIQQFQQSINQPTTKQPNLYKPIHNKSHLKSVDIQQKSKTIKKTQSYNDTYLYNKFINEINNILTKIIKKQGNQLLTHKISYIEYLQSLKSLKMIHESYEPHHKDVIGELWHQQISQNNTAHFIFIISCILKLYDQQNDQNATNKSLSNKYSQMRMTRLQLYGHPQQNLQTPFNFKPILTKKSQALAASRSKSKQGTNRYPFNKVKTDVSMDKSMHYTQQFNDTHHKTERNLDNTGNKRSEILYQLAKSKSAKKQRLNVDIEYQKNLKQLTFKPSINREKSSQKINNKVKGESNTITRMIKGRVEKEIKSILNQKGNTYNQKVMDKIRKQKYKDIVLKATENNKNNEGKIKDNKDQPANNLDNKDHKENKSKDMIVVNIFIEEDRCEKLIYYKGDESITEAAERFIKQFKLGTREKEKLIKQLENVIKFSLTSIKEEQDESVEKQI